MKESQAKEPFPEVPLMTAEQLEALDGRRALKILASLEALAAFPLDLRRCRPLAVSAQHRWEYRCGFIGKDCEFQQTGPHRSLLGCLAAVVEMLRESQESQEGSQQQASKSHQK